MLEVTTLDACPICQSPRMDALPPPARWIGRDVFAPVAGKLGLARCRDCDLVFVNPRPAPDLLARFYTSPGYVCHAADGSELAARKALARLGELGRLAPPRPGARLLDYGCGGGALLRVAREAGWNAIGYDIGGAALASCRRQGLPVTSDLDSLSGQRFDAIVLIHVLEHLSDPCAVLERLRGLLAPGGRLCIEVPNARSLRATLAAPELASRLGLDERYRAFPIHLDYYCKRTLPRLLERAGFSVDLVTTLGLGLDELFVRPEIAPPDVEPGQPAGVPPAPAAPAAPRISGPRQRAKSLLKKVFFERGLGENLMVIARPRPEARPSLPPRVTSRDAGADAGAGPGTGGIRPTVIDVDLSLNAVADYACCADVPLRDNA